MHANNCGRLVDLIFAKPVEVANLNPFSRAIGERLAAFLTKSLPGYQRIDTISIDRVAASLQTGDILLVEGNTRISTAIKYLTQSSWSHACLFIGEAGEDSSTHNLIEADLKEGVRLVNLDHFAEFNLRICRPVNLTAEDTQHLVQFAKSKLGHKYDLRNVFDLIRYVIQKPAVPNRYRRAMLSLGSGEPTRAICSTLISTATWPRSIHSTKVRTICSLAKRQKPRGTFHASRKK